MKKTIFFAIVYFSCLVVIAQQPTVYLPQTITAPTIDGLPDLEWITIPKNQIDQPYNGILRDSTDLSGSWKAMWDYENIYLYFVIYDDSLYNLGSGASKFWIHDCAEIFFDMLNNKDQINTDESATDENYQYRFIWNLDNEPVYEKPPTQGMENKSHTLMVENKTIGYSIEIKLPWKSMLATHNFGNVEIGKLIGAEFKICDLDASTVPSAVWSPDAELVWNNTTKKDLKVTSMFGTIRLVGSLTNDQVAPQSITTLQAVTTGSKSAKLSWKAPADENFGTVDFYEIRYSTQPITHGNWSEATLVANSISSSASGESHTLDIDGLLQNTEYYFGIKSKDHLGNTSAVSNVATIKTIAQDLVAPAQITDLKIFGLDSYTVSFEWTAPGDDGNTGKIVGYEIKLSNLAITAENWDEIPNLIHPIEILQAGEKQTIKLLTLNPEKTYYIAIKAFDEEPNFSAISNIVTFATPTFVYKTLFSMDKFIGTNSFIDVPHDKVKPVGFIREYHPWSFTEISNDAFEFNRWNGYWNFDKFYEDLKNAGVTVCPAIFQSPGWLEAEAHNKPVGSNESATNPESYTEMAQMMYQYAARYGANTVDQSKLLVASGQVKKSGLGFLKYYEDWNEQDGDWAGRDALFIAEEYAAMASANCDGHAGTLGDGYGIKTADPNAKFVMGGLAYLGTSYLRSMYNWFETNRSDKRWPIDVINMHHYAEASGKNGICPEADNFKSKVQEVTEWRNRYAPTNELWITEFGYDTNDQSPNQINVFGGFDQQEIQAQWLVRTFLILSSCGVDRAAQFMLRDEVGNEPRFRNCGLTEPSSYGYKPKKSWYYTYTLKNVLGNFYFDKVVSETNNAWVYRFVSPESDKYIYAIWSPTGNGTESTYRITIPVNPKHLYKIELTDKSIEGTATALDKTKSTFNIAINERPVFVVADYSIANDVDVQSVDNLEIIDVFPNPASANQLVHIDLQNYGNIQKSRISIYDLSGVQVYQRVVNGNASSFDINPKGLASGVYMLKITINDTNTLQRKIAIIE